MMNLETDTNYKLINNEKMKRNYFLLPIIALSMSLTPVFSSCSDDDENKIELNSYLNGTYSGTQLEVTIDGQKNTSVTSAEVKVEAASQNSTIDVTLNDFPTAGKDHTLKTTLENETIKGTTNFQGKTYTFSVKIEGGYGADKNKSCKIIFSSKN